MAMMHLLKASRLGCSSTSLRLMNATVGTQVRASTTSILQATDVAAAQPYLGKPLGQMPFKLINGAQLWYDDWGGDGEPLIFMHGYTGSRIHWGHDKGGAAWKLAHELGPGKYRCIFLEARGCNESAAAPGPYTVEQQASDVLALADSLGISTFTYCGHSMGGGVGWYLAVTHRERLKKMVLMAPTATDGRNQGWPDGQAFEGPRKHILEWFMWLPKFTEADTPWLIERLRVLSENRDKDTEEFFQHRARCTAVVPEEYWTEALLSVAKLRLAEKVKDVTMPILILAGAVDDLVYVNIDDARRLQNGSLHVFSGAGHEPALDDPDGVAKAIHGFMSGKTFSRNAHYSLIGKRLMDRGHGLPNFSGGKASKL